MNIQMILVLVLTFFINFIGTVGYSTRIVGIRTGKITISLSIFNVIMLFSRGAVTIQMPLLSKRLDESIDIGTSSEFLIILRYILLSATLGCMFGAFLMPTFQRFFYKAVESFNIYRSVPRLIIHGFSKAGITQFKKCIKVPSRESINELRNFNRMPKKVLLFNIAATAASSAAVLSSLYAGALLPGYRATCTSLSSVINWIPTLLLTLFIDPVLSVITDDVLEGNYSLSSFSRCIKFMVAGRVLGTVAAQLVLVPGALIIQKIAVMI